MEYDKLVINGTVVFGYDTAENIQRDIFMNTKLKDFTQRFETPVTNEIPAIIDGSGEVEFRPMIGCCSKDGHTIFNANTNTAIVRSEYNKECLEYETISNQLKNDSILTYYLMNQALKGSDLNFTFFGYSIRIIINTPQYDDCNNSIDYLLKKYMNLSFKGMLAGSGLNFAYIDKDLYVNYDLSHMIPQLKNEEECSPHLAITIDVNDKAFSTVSDSKYNLDKRRIERIHKKLFQVFDSIDDLLERNEVVTNVK